MEWNGHCTHPTRVSKHCSIWVELTTYYDSRAISWVWLQETISAAARAARLALPFVLGLLNLCLFRSTVTPVQECCVTLGSIFPFLLRCLWYLSWVTSRTRRCNTDEIQLASLQEHDGSISTTP